MRYRCECGYVFETNTWPARCICRRKHVAPGVLAEVKEERPELLGDWVERQFKNMGITQDRYNAVKEIFGLPPKCGCAERKKWLNDVSAWFKGIQ